MDFHTLSRKQLQALCKRNKIPANMTNVAMADSLAALEQLEGIEEVLDPVDTDSQKFPDEKGVGTPACRMSTRRKPVVEEPESSKISTRLRRGARARNDEEIDQENKDLNVPVTPAAPTTRRRAPAVSTRRKKEDEKSSYHVPKTPAASNSRVKATSAYNTRKSVRLLEKSLSKMSIVDKEGTGPVNVDEISEKLNSISQQMEDAVDTEDGASSLAISTEVTEKTDESEVTSSEKNFSKISLVHADEAESVKIDEISEEMTDLPQKIEESEDAVEGASSQTISTDDIEKTDELEITSSEKNTEFECKSNDSNSEMNNSSGSEVELTKSIAKEVNDANNESGTEIICQIENSCYSSELNDAFSGDNEAVVKMGDDSAEIHVSKVDDEVDASMIVEVKNEASEHSDVGNDTQNSGGTFCYENNKDAVEIACEFQNPEVFPAEDKTIEIARGIEEETISPEKESIETAHDNQNSEEMFSSEDKAVETFCHIQNSEEMFSAEKKVVEVEDNTSPHVHEELEFRTSSDIEESKEYAENDAVMDVCNEPSSEENTDAQGVADSQSPLVINEAKAESETADVQSLLEAEAESETADAQSPLVINEAKAESETADVQSLLEAEAESETADAQSLLVRAEAEAESETADVQISNEDCKENADVPTATFAAPISSEQKATDVPEGDKQKKNQINDDLNSKSMRQLKKMLKNLSLENETNNDKSNNNSVKEVVRKRTALQELPENRMTAS